jgi:hypothetical protein
MAGKLTISTLNDSSGVLATQNGMTGIAKAWVCWNGYTSPNTTINASFNVSSITYSSIGAFVVNFTTAMPNYNYAVNVSSGPGDAYRGAPMIGTYINGNPGTQPEGNNKLTTSCAITSGYPSGAGMNQYSYSASFFSS